MEDSKVLPISPTVSSTCRSFRFARYVRVRMYAGACKRAFVRACVRAISFSLARALQPYHANAMPPILSIHAMPLLRFSLVGHTSRFSH